MQVFSFSGVCYVLQIFRFLLNHIVFTLWTPKFSDSHSNPLMKQSKAFYNLHSQILFCMLLAHCELIQVVLSYPLYRSRSWFQDWISSWLNCCDFSSPSPARCNRTRYLEVESTLRLWLGFTQTLFHIFLFISLDFLSSGVCLHVNRWSQWPQGIIVRVSLKTLKISGICPPWCFTTTIVTLFITSKNFDQVEPQCLTAIFLLNRSSKLYLEQAFENAEC